MNDEILVKRLNEMIKTAQLEGDVYHTFRQLYNHRLFFFTLYVMYIHMMGILV